ncbi:hypothetical protein GCM10020255_080690 [Rhodococcus baikonurensis]
MDGSPDRGIVSAARPDDELTFPLSAAQLSLLVAQQLRPEIPVSIAQYVDVDGPLDIELLTAASKQTGREIGSGYLRLVEVDGVARQWLDLDMDDSSTWSIFETNRIRNRRRESGCAESTLLPSIRSPIAWSGWRS